MLHIKLEGASSYRPKRVALRSHDELVATALRIRGHEPSRCDALRRLAHAHSAPLPLRRRTRTQLSKSIASIKNVHVTTTTKETPKSKK